MAVTPAVDEDLDHGEVGLVGVLVASLLRRPSEDVQREVRVRLDLQGVADLGRGESGLEGLDPRLELLLDRGTGSGSDWDRRIRFWRRGGGRAWAGIKRLKEWKYGIGFCLGRGEREKWRRGKFWGSESGGENAAYGHRHCWRRSERETSVNNRRWSGKEGGRGSAIQEKWA